MKQSHKGKFLLFGFDMETDVGSTSRNYAGVQNGTRAIIEILERHGAKATFFFTGDCALKNGNILELVNGKGFEIGCHSMFHEDMGEPSFETSSQGTVLEEELEHRLSMNKRIVRDAMGKDPVSFRSPRGFGSNMLMRTLAKLGFMIDSSYMQSMHLKRNYPYFVSPDDWREEGQGDILELPLFAFDLDNASDNTYQKKLDCWPRIRTHGADFVFANMQPIVEKQVTEKGRSALAFYLHPWEFHPMPRSITYAEGTLSYDEFLYKNTGKKQAEEFDRFLTMCLADGFTIMDFRTFREIFVREAHA
jgi:peptidoglycan/xylan/chitin deacetylase (PgdA/CDA1 family)